MYKFFFKRVIDILFSLCGLAVLSPFLLIIMWVLLIFNKGAGVFFLQQRVGKDARLFRIIKFKTLTDEKDAEGNLLPDHRRLTKIGKFIRSSSVDEIPQLINVLKGDMSIVGPRPLMESYLPLYSEVQARRHEVYPGITGWTQCNGRNSISWQQKFGLDVWYVDHLSLFVDLKIMFLTIRKVLKTEGIYQDSSIESTVPFNGHN